jgi:hypothetical protein
MRYDQDCGHTQMHCRSSSLLGLDLVAVHWIRPLSSLFANPGRGFGVFEADQMHNGEQMYSSAAMSDPIRLDRLRHLTQMSLLYHEQGCTQQQKTDTLCTLCSQVLCILKQVCGQGTGFITVFRHEMQWAAIPCVSSTYTTSRLSTRCVATFGQAGDVTEVCSMSRRYFRRP